MVCRKTVEVLSFAILMIMVGCQAKSESGGQDTLERQRRQADSQAVQYLLRAQEVSRQGGYRQALALTDSARQREPELADIYFVRGNILSELKRYDDAQKEYQRVASIAPRYKGVWYNMANNAFRATQYREAIEWYRKEQQQYPSAHVLTNLGHAYARLGKVDSARQAYEQAIASDSTFALAHVRLGQLYDEDGEIEKALRYSRRGLQLEPDNSNYHYIVGSQLLQSGQPEEAISHLRRTVEERPAHQGAHLNLGKALMRLGNQDEGERYLTRADSLSEEQAKLKKLRNRAQSYPDDLRVWLDLGNALRERHQFEEALEAYQIAYSLAPQDIKVRGTLADMHLRTGSPRQALQLYQSVLQQEPQNVSAWFNVGVIFANAGQTQQAERAWKTVLRYDADHERARAYLAKLSEAS